MATLEKQITDLRAQIESRRAEVKRLETDEERLALSDPEKAIAAGDRATSTRRLVPRLEAEYRRLVTRKVAEDIEAARTAIDAQMEKDLAAKAASYPALWEALNGMVAPIRTLAAQKDFMRLRVQFDFLSTSPWAELMENLGNIFEQWKADDRRSAEAASWAQKEQARRVCESAAGELLAELALLVKEEQPAAEVTA
ncbi:MAG: hypothetical protein ABSG38_16435 [Spirochaetia bacterium]|jgi:hypothetical protein